MLVSMRIVIVGGVGGSSLSGGTLSVRATLGAAADDALAVGGPALTP